MSRKNLISYFILTLTILIYSSALPHTLKIFGKNRLSYWQWRENEENFIEDALDINAMYGNFRGNIEWYIYEPSNVKYALRKEGMRRRFVEFKNPKWSLRAGNFYQSFGRGLILNQTVEITGNIDRDIDGFNLSHSIKFLTISLLSGRPKNLLFSNGKYIVVNDTSDLLQGGSLSFDLLPSFPFSINVVRLSSDNPGVESPRETYLYAFNIDVVKGPFIIYAEYAKREGWDEIPFEESEGNGIYGSLTFSTGKASATFEYLNYDKLGYGGSDYRYNAPPTGNLDGYSINRARDERGWMLDIISNPFGSWYFEVNKSMLWTISSDSIGFDEFYAEIKGDIWKRGPSLLLSLKNLVYRKPETIIDRKSEWIPHIGIMSSLGSHSLNVGLNSRVVEIDTITFMDNAVSIDACIFSYLTIAGRWEIRNKEALLESEGMEWKVIELRWDISDSHTLNIMAGSEKGGLICSGGVCRIEEPFEGIKINLLSRF